MNKYTNSTIYDKTQDNILLSKQNKEILYTPFQDVLNEHIFKEKTLKYINEANFTTGDGVNYIYLTNLQDNSIISDQAISTITSVTVQLQANISTQFEAKLCYVSSYVSGLPVYTDISTHTIPSGNYDIQYATNTVSNLTQNVAQNPLVLAVKQLPANSRIVVKYQYQ
jgi:hypothetical protein